MCGVSGFINFNNNDIDYSLISRSMNNELMKEFFPFSKLIDQDVNVLIFPYLSAGNIAYKLVQEMSHNEAIGPVLNGLRKSVHILQMGSSVQEIVNMVTIAVIDAQYNED